MSNINIGISIDLQKLIDTRLLLQAGSGGGKSYALRKIIESVGNKVQQIIIDPEGEFVTLREKFDFALVSKGGDIPLSLKYAETLAHKILETGLSVIIDLYELQQHERILFVKRFLQAMINAPKDLWHPCIVHIDEAHIFCPESSTSESTSAVIDLCTRGRKRGYCAVLATQRLPKLNKDATAECNNKMIGRSAQDIDRRRAGEELGMTAKADVLSIRDIDPGHFYAFGPAISNKVVKFRVSQVTTTHLQSGKRMITAPPTPEAIKKILNKLSDIPEEAEKELQTKQQFHKEIARLKTELSKASKGMSSAPIQNIDKVINAAKEEVKRQYAALIKERDGIIAATQNQVRKFQATLAKICQMAGDEPMASSVVSAPAPSQIRREEKPVPRQMPMIENTSNLGKCARAIIVFLASRSDREWSKVQVAVAVGYSVGSGGFNNSLAELNARGFIIRDGKLRANPDALNAIEEAVGRIESMEYSIETFKENLGKCEREIYEVLLEHPYDQFFKDALASKTPSNYSAVSGGFNNALARLNTLGLIIRESGKIQLNPELLDIQIKN